MVKNTNKNFELVFKLKSSILTYVLFSKHSITYMHMNIQTHVDINTYKHIIHTTQTHTQRHIHTQTYTNTNIDAYININKHKQTQIQIDIDKHKQTHIKMIILGSWVNISKGWSLNGG